MNDLFLFGLDRLEVRDVELADGLQRGLDGPIGPGPQACRTQLLPHLS